MKLPTRLLAGAATWLFTTGIAAAATVVADANLNVRSGPGIQYRVIAVIPDGVAVNASDCQGGWCHVDYRGHIGWASSAYLTGAVAAAPYYYNEYPYYYNEPYYACNEPFFGCPYDYGLFGFGFGPTFAYVAPGVAVNHFRFHHFAGFHHFAHFHNFAARQFAAPHFAGAHFAGGPHFGGAHFAGGAHFGRP
jgi:Bacterial SH3 domain